MAYLEAHPEDFDKLLGWFTTDSLYAWKAAWLLACCMDTNDNRVRKHVKGAISVLPKRKDNHQRELLKVLYQMDIPQDLEGLLFDHCVGIWQKVNQQSSVRCIAFKILLQIARRYPELHPEVISLTESHYMDPLTPAIKKSVYKLIEGFRNSSFN